MTIERANPRILSRLALSTGLIAALLLVGFHATAFALDESAQADAVPPLDRRDPAVDPDDPDDPDEEGDGEKKEGEETVDPEESVKKIKEMMNQAEELLDDLKTGKNTQAEQQRIIAELQRLIDEMNRRNRGGGGGGGGEQKRQQSDRQPQDRDQQNPQDQKHQPKDQQSDQQKQNERQPMKKDMVPPPKGGQARNERQEERPKPPPQLRRAPLRKGGANVHERWGLLPPREREDRLHQRQEQVPERFRLDVEKYRKRLATGE